MLTSTQSKIIIAVIVVAILIAGAVMIFKPADVVGVVGGQAIEDYMPYYRMNGGMYTGLPVSIASDLTVSGNTSISSTTLTKVGVGSSGTVFTAIIAGSPSTCTASSSIPAGQSARQECALAGLLSTDEVFISPGATSSNVFLAVTGGFASTTANGFLEIIITNSSSTAAITSSQNDVRNVDYIIFR